MANRAAPEIRVQRAVEAQTRPESPVVGLISVRTILCSYSDLDASRFDGAVEIAAEEGLIAAGDEYAAPIESVEQLRAAQEHVATERDGGKPFIGAAYRAIKAKQPDESEASG